MARQGGHRTPRSYVQRITDHGLRRLKADIILAGLRQVEIAKALDIDPSRLSKVLNGWLPPKPEEIAAIRTCIKTAKEGRGKSRR
jgi:hypothetical protein